MNTTFAPAPPAPLPVPNQAGKSSAAKKWFAALSVLLLLLVGGLRIARVVLRPTNAGAPPRTAAPQVRHPQTIPSIPNTKTSIPGNKTSVPGTKTSIPGVKSPVKPGVSTPAPIGGAPRATPTTVHR